MKRWFVVLTVATFIFYGVGLATISPGHLQPGIALIAIGTVLMIMALFVGAVMYNNRLESKRLRRQAVALANSRS